MKVLIILFTMILTGFAHADQVKCFSEAESYLADYVDTHYFKLLDTKVFNEHHEVIHNNGEYNPEYSRLHKEDYEIIDELSPNSFIFRSSATEISYGVSYQDYLIIVNKADCSLKLFIEANSEDGDWGG